MALSVETRIYGVLAIVFGCLFYAVPCYAYIDPGTGSIILQSILASIAVAIGLLRLYWYRFKSFVSNLTGTSQPQNDGNDSGFGQDADIQNDS